MVVVRVDVIGVKSSLLLLLLLLFLVTLSGGDRVGCIGAGDKSGKGIDEEEHNNRDVTRAVRIAKIIAIALNMRLAGLRELLSHINHALMKIVQRVSNTMQLKPIIQ